MRSARPWPATVRGKKLLIVAQKALPPTPSSMLLRRIDEAVDAAIKRQPSRADGIAFVKVTKDFNDVRKVVLI